MVATQRRARFRLSAVTAIVERSVREFLSYRMTVLVRILNVIVMATGFGVLANAVGHQAPEIERDWALDGAADYVTFVIVGWLVQNFVWSAKGAISSRIHGQGFAGLLTAPCSIREVVFALTLWPVCWRLIESATILAVATLVFGLELHLSFWLVGVVIGAVMIVLGLDLVSAAILMVVKGQTEPVSWLLETTGLMFAGTLFPVSALPAWASSVAQWHPQFHLNRIARRVLSGTADTEVLIQLAWLGAAASLVLLLGLIAFGWGLRFARAHGTLGHV